MESGNNPLVDAIAGALIQSKFTIKFNIKNFIDRPKYNQQHVYIREYICIKLFFVVISLLENTVEGSRQREAILDETLASTDISQARHQLYQPLEGYNPPKLDQSLVECNNTKQEDKTKMKEKDDHD